MHKLTIEMINENGRSFAIDEVIVPQRVALLRGVPLMAIRLDGASVTLPRETLGKMLAATQNAEIAGSEYPDDWRDFVGLNDPPSMRRMPGEQARDEARSIIRALLDHSAGHADGKLQQWQHATRRARTFLGD